ncbi:MAG: hypothetical protein V4519_05200 [Patescibacteria group bacterium]
MNQSLEKKYKEKLDQEFPSAPINILQITEAAPMQNVDELYEERVSYLSERNIDEIFSDETMTVAHCEKLILFYLLEEGTVYYEDIVSMLHTEAVMAESPSPSLEVYALRKAWNNIPKLLVPAE